MENFSVIVKRVTFLSNAYQSHLRRRSAVFNGPLFIPGTVKIAEQFRLQVLPLHHDLPWQTHFEASIAWVGKNISYSM